MAVRIRICADTPCRAGPGSGKPPHAAGVHDQIAIQIHSCGCDGASQGFKSVLRVIRRVENVDLRGLASKRLDKTEVVVVTTVGDVKEAVVDRSFAERLLHQAEHARFLEDDANGGDEAVPTQEPNSVGRVWQLAGYADVVEHGRGFARKAQPILLFRIEVRPDTRGLVKLIEPQHAFDEKWFVDPDGIRKPNA